jgi:hypothetical protein
MRSEKRILIREVVANAAAFQFTPETERFCGEGRFARLREERERGPGCGSISTIADNGIHDH